MLEISEDGAFIVGKHRIDVMTMCEKGANRESQMIKDAQTKVTKQDGNAKSATHYQQADIEPIEIMQKYFTAEMMHGFCLGNVIKYALRARFKGSEMKDIEKMAQYAKWDVQVMKAEWIDPRKG